MVKHQPGGTSVISIHVVDTVTFEEKSKDVTVSAVLLLQGWKM